MSERENLRVLNSVELSTAVKVLSIQSHVVHGYCGNKSAVFPLQLLGVEVDQINSVQLSNHTGYKTIKGQKLGSSELGDLFDGLVANNLHEIYTHLLTGYVGNDKFLREIKRIIKELRDANPNICYVCDPVLGDYGADGIGRLYVPEALVSIYRDEIIPLADIVTPNQFEVELITEKKISTETDAWEGAQWFHDRGVKIVALSSTSTIGDDYELVAFLSAVRENGKLEKFKLSIPKQCQIHFTGTGDLFAALFMAHSATHPNDLGRALELTIASVQSTIEMTLNLMPEELKTGKVSATAQQRELKIIQSKKFIENPEIKLKAIRVE